MTQSPSRGSPDSDRLRALRLQIARELMASEEDYVDTVEALLSTVIRPCLGEGSRGARYPPVSRREAQQMFGGLRGEEILNRNTELRNDVSNSDTISYAVAGAS